MTLEEYNELESLLNKHDSLIEKMKRSCEYCLFFEVIKEEDMIPCEGWCKLMPSLVRKATWDYCGQYKKRF